MRTQLKLAAGVAVVIVTLVGIGVLSMFSGQDRIEEGAAIARMPAAPGQTGGELGRTAPEEVARERREVDLQPKSATDEGEATTQTFAETARSTIIARLVDSAGTPLPGARLASIYSDGRPRGDGNSAQADSEGRVALSIADADMRAMEEQVFPMVFSASMEGHATGFVVSTPLWHGETDLGDIVLEPGGGLKGIVVDSWGQPVAHAVLYAGEPVLTGDLEAMRLSGPDTMILRPRGDGDASGRFLMSGIGLGETRLWVHAVDHLWTITDPLEVVPGAPRDCGTIVLEEVPAEQRISGLVLRPNGTPAAGAEVSFESDALMQEGKLLADSQGRFRMVPRGDGLVNLVARDPAGRFGTSATVPARVGAEIQLELTERRVISVRVTDTEGQPIERAAVMPFLLDGPGMNVGFRVIPGQDWIRTDSGGLAVVPAPPEPFRLSASLRGYKAQRFGPYQPENAPRELLIELEAEPRIEGRVLAYGQPVAGMKITIGQRIPGFVPREAGFPTRFFTNQNHRIESDQEGRFACPVDEDWTEVTVLARGGTYAAGEIELTLEKGKGASGVVVEVTLGGVVTGSVTPPLGQGVRGLVVAASRGDGHPVWTRVDVEGHYRLENLTPGSWRVEGREREPAREMLSVANRPEDKEFGWNVLVVDGQEVRFDVDMRALGQVDLFGRFSIDGVGAAGWTAELVPPMEVLRREAMPAVRLASDGSFTLGARAGRHDLRLLGTLDGGVRVEVLREIELVGPRMDWDDDLTTGPLSESVDAEHEEVRLVRGHFYRGDREITFVPLDQGQCEARVPSGESSLQVSAGMTGWGPAWKTARRVDVP